jgi:hypothetical protein
MRKGVTPSQAAPSKLSSASAGGMEGRNIAGGTGQCRNSRSCHCIASTHGRFGRGQGRCAAFGRSIATPSLRVLPFDARPSAPRVPAYHGSDAEKGIVNLTANPQISWNFE